MKKCIGTVAIAAVGVLSAGCASARLRPASAFQGEITLRPGTLPGLPAAAVGDPVMFVNDISDARCFPLFAVSGWADSVDRGRHPNGTLSTWIVRAHVTAGRLFVQPCNVAVPIEMSTGQLGGIESDEWFEATISRGARPAISLKPLGIRRLDGFSNPSFCGRFVAYWHQASSGEMTASVADLLEPSRKAHTQSVGVEEIEGTDMGLGVAQPRWSGDCSAATFTARSGRTATVRSRG